MNIEVYYKLISRFGSVGDDNNLREKNIVVKLISNFFYSQRRITIGEQIQRRSSKEQSRKPTKTKTVKNKTSA